jgi:hypothetical protein
MPRVQFGLSAFERWRGNGPQLPVINMFAEQTPTEETGVLLQSRPGLSDREADMGAGPVEELFQKDGVLSGALFGVSDGELYQGTTALGGILGTGAVSMAGNSVGLMTTAGAGLAFWDGTTLAPVTFPDDANVTKVFEGASRFIALRAGTGKFYWTEPLDTTFDALAFATAESRADPLLDGLFLKDGLVLFGSETVEFWPNTNDPELPFQPLEGMVFQKGVRATGCASRFGTTFAWVTNNNEVCLSDPDSVISNPGLEEKIAASASCRLWTFLIEGQEFLAVRVDAGTWVYGFRNRMWSQFTSYGDDNWIPQCFADGIFGSSIDGRTLAFNDQHLDDDGELERRFRFGAQINGGTVNVNKIALRTNPGRTPYNPDDNDPTVELRMSRDGGATWGAWRSTSLGEKGEYRKRVEWRSCGLASAPGVFGEIRVTAPVPFAVAGVFMNEQSGGR